MPFARLDLLSFFKKNKIARQVFLACPCHSDRFFLVHSFLVFKKKWYARSSSPTRRRKAKVIFWLQLLGPRLEFLFHARLLTVVKSPTSPMIGHPQRWQDFQDRSLSLFDWLYWVLRWIIDRLTIDRQQLDVVQVIYTINFEDFGKVDALWLNVKVWI